MNDLHKCWVNFDETSGYCSLTLTTYIPVLHCRWPPEPLGGPPSLSWQSLVLPPTNTVTWMHTFNKLNCSSIWKVHPVEHFHQVGNVGQVENVCHVEKLQVHNVDQVVNWMVTNLVDCILQHLVEILSNPIRTLTPSQTDCLTMNSGESQQHESVMVPTQVRLLTACGRFLNCLTKKAPCLLFQKI